jgi:hypothetical protein
MRIYLLYVCLFTGGGSLCAMHDAANAKTSKHVHRFVYVVPTGQATHTMQKRVPQAKMVELDALLRHVSEYTFLGH